MFRLWYHACQLANVAIIAMVAIVALSLTLLKNVEAPPWAAAVIWIPLIYLGAMGITGAVLGLIGVMNGIRESNGYITIRSACPKCGRPALWDFPAKGYVAIECEECGLYGGQPWRDLAPRFLREFYEDVTEDEDDADRADSM